MRSDVALPGFDEMNLSPAVLSAVKKVGYECPTPVQALTIPSMCEGRNLIGQARTGTGKTAAFALPLLSRIDTAQAWPQVLVLTPTRELAVQVAAAFKDYGAGMPGLNVLAIYGGQGYGHQLGGLKRGAHVVVGTPGRVMDHLTRKTLVLDRLRAVVLDEADEMLHMGFVEDVSWILEKTPKGVQTALFSATMPDPIRKLAQKYVQDPEQVNVQSDRSETLTIDQQYWLVQGTDKKRALVRFLEASDWDGVMVFVRTRSATLEVAQHLESAGFSAQALNGDMAQNAREQAVGRLKNGRTDILVATDIAARGLDVDRISHVVNYDMPSRTEPYVHRIGRTGRAGRNGTALLFLNRNQRWMLKKIHKATGQQAVQVELPTNARINQKRRADFKARITRGLSGADLPLFRDLIQEYAREYEVPLADVAAALAGIGHDGQRFFLPENDVRSGNSRKTETVPAGQRKNGEIRPKESRTEKQLLGTQKIKAKKETTSHQAGPGPDKGLGERPVEKGMERYRIEVGRHHGLKAGDIVGAISNEAGLAGKYIANIRIQEEFSLVDLPFGMPKTIFRHLKKVWVRSRPMAISKYA